MLNIRLVRSADTYFTIHKKFKYMNFLKHQLVTNYSSNTIQNTISEISDYEAPVMLIKTYLKYGTKHNH